MSNNIDEILNTAMQKTKKTFIDELSSLTKLTSNEVDNLLTKDKFQKQDLKDVIVVLKDKTLSNNLKAVKLKLINNSFEILTKISEKII